MLQAEARVAVPPARRDKAPDSKDVLSNMYKLGARRWHGSKQQHAECLTTKIKQSMRRMAVKVKTLQQQKGREVSTGSENEVIDP